MATKVNLKLSSKIIFQQPSGASLKIKAAIFQMKLDKNDEKVLFSKPQYIHTFFFFPLDASHRINCLFHLRPHI